MRLRHVHMQVTATSPRRIVWTSIVSMVLIAATPVWSAPPTPASSSPVASASAPVDDEATLLKKKGDLAMLELRYEDALAAYASSYALRPNPALHYNRARALEALTRYAEALAEYEAFIREAPEALQAKVPGMSGHVAQLRAKTSEVLVNVKTPGARIILRGVELGASPLAGPLRVNAGKASLEVVAEGYARYERTIDLPSGGKLVIDVELVAKNTSAQLSIHGEPSATVVLDGKTLGSSPLETIVSAGTHTLTLSKAGFVTRTTTVVVAVGENKRVDVSLEREAGLLSRWWFWTGVGVVVVGASVLTYRALAPSEPARGDIDPGQITSPFLRF